MTYTSESLGKPASGNPLTQNVHIADNPPVRSKSRREEVIRMAKKTVEAPKRKGPGRPPKAQAKAKAEKPQKGLKTKPAPKATRKAK